MRRFLPFFALLLIPIAAVVYVILTRDDNGGEDVGNGPTPNAEGNLIADGGFEESTPCTTEEGTTSLQCWFSLREPAWEPSTERALSGQQSALLRMRETAAGEETKIHYLVQEFDLDSGLPEVISGDYFVENWQSGTRNQYLQFVIVLWSDEFTSLPPDEVTGDPFSNYQIRYLLAGIDEDPFGIRNAKFMYINTEDPVEGEWVHFERNLRDDFEAVWGGIPDEANRIRLLFEVRYDDKLPDEGPLEADVYYDNLYLGSAETAP